MCWIVKFVLYMVRVSLDLLIYCVQSFTAVVHIQFMNGGLDFW